ncbi:MAG: gfo/Idh/MocA family oxidoreductase [Candidatus Heimdallarchaeota archaeon]|nr:gfo/Idh/MocA family oxidoreductase [Candidatus Heimdallarchaeota archaeon]
MMNMPEKRSKTPLKMGLIGCGWFGRFCLTAYSKTSDIELIAVADTNAKIAKETGDLYGVRWYSNPDQIINNPEIDLVHIATPPNTHASFASQALQQMKHVLCEKPLALSIEEGNQLVNLAKAKNRILPVNFILRYVPIVDIIKEIIDNQLFGKPIRAYFENYAADEKLHPKHWFWDSTQSGGIFIEHGVHFFDLYQYWFGNSEVLWATRLMREGTAIEDRVYCAMKHASGVFSSHYHGFDQPDLLDRQVHGILFETADILIKGWIPLSIEIQGYITKENSQILQSICPEGNLSINDKTPSKMTGRWKNIQNVHEFRFDYQLPDPKFKVYAQAVQALIRDQIRYILDPTHQRVIDEMNGLETLKLAVLATKKRINR